MTRLLLPLFCLSLIGCPANDCENTITLRELYQLAENGDPHAQWELGLFCENEEDRVEAVRWFRRAAAQQYPDAEHNLGICYFFGEGVPEDRAEAVKWFRKAAENDLPKAQFILGMCYLRGDGIPADREEGMRWLRKAVEGGDPNAARVLELEQ